MEFHLNDKNVSGRNLVVLCSADNETAEYDIIMMMMMMMMIIIIIIIIVVVVVVIIIIFVTNFIRHSLPLLMT